MTTNSTVRSGRPLVSIGLPVYNGANYLRHAIDSILAQTYRDLELIISDNASTDGTAAICQEAAARDARVRVVRNAENIGAAGNYNAVFHASRGAYFKWAAHDDVLEPTFVERAVDVLERNPDVVLCSARTKKIDVAGNACGYYDGDPAWADPARSRRFRSLIFTQHACTAVFGLIRREALAATPLIAPYVGSDRVLLAELALHGRVFEIPEELFSRRDHPGSSVRSFPDVRRRVVWFDPKKSAKFALPEWNYVFGYAGAVHRAKVSLVDRARCWLIVASWSLRQWRSLLSDFKYVAFRLVSRKTAEGL